MISKSDGETQPSETKPSHSSLISKNITVAKHRTSVRLEPEMWQGLMEICRRERANLHEVCSTIAQYKSEDTSLTAAIRVFTMAYFRTAATEEGHNKAGHGQRLAHTVLAPVVQTAMSNAAPATSASGYMGGNDRHGGKAASY